LALLEGALAAAGVAEGARLYRPRKRARQGYICMKRAADRPRYPARCGAATRPHRELLHRAFSF
jgi:hypothetical protein